MHLIRMTFPVMAVAMTILVWLGPLAKAEETDVIQGKNVPPVERTAPVLQPIRTDSPRDTIETFKRLRDELETALLDYRDHRTLKKAQHLRLLGERFRALIDLEEVAVASRREVGNSTIMYLLDIFGRVSLPNPDDVPDADTFEDEHGAQYRIQGTPIRIVRVGNGPRYGEYLFNGRTVSVAPRFYRSIEELPLHSALGISSWSEYIPQLTGPLIPDAVIAAIPHNLRALWLDTPLWKVLTVIVIAMLAGWLLARLHRWLFRKQDVSRFGSISWRLMRPISILLVVVLLIPLADQQINTSGRFSAIVDIAATVIIYVSAAWLFWLTSRIFCEWLILSPRIAEESLDANLLRLVGGALGIVGGLIILTYGGHRLGFPILSILAGLGIGGLAVALAVRPTLENLIGGVILYSDKPVRVGDFCSFGDKTGTVEAIGVRSTQLRALDRTLITVPNAQFADMEIINWADCDEMLIHETIGLRYDTSVDQLRYFLTKLREMLHAHPRINSDTIRVRFFGYGDSSLDVMIRIYAKTREWNDFFAIREDVFLRIYDLVSDAGTGFAFPTQTVYLGKDTGLDSKTAEKAADEVKKWRRAGQLPFPHFTSEMLEKIADTLDYPPRGSCEAGQEAVADGVGAERLSVDSQPGEGHGADEPEETGRKPS